MIKKLVFNFLGFALCFSAFAQDQYDGLIQINKERGGYTFEQNGSHLSQREMFDLMVNNNEAYLCMQNSKNFENLAILSGCAAGGLFGWTIGTAHGDGKVNFATLGAGCGFTLLCIPLLKLSEKKQLMAVDKYNAKKKGLSYNRQCDLQLGLGSNGLALSFKF